jgi:D-galactarolactone cycloisomerase
MDKLLDRRSWLRHASFVGASATLLGAGLSGCTASDKPNTSNKASDAPNKASLLGFADYPNDHYQLGKEISAPLLLERLELLRLNDNEAMLIAHIQGGPRYFLPSNKRFLDDIPMFTGRVLPFFLRQDLRAVEVLIERCYRANYKLSGLPFWNAIGHIEMLALECMGQAAQQSVAALLGGKKREQVAVYISTRERTTTPEQEIDEFVLPRSQLVGARACKLGIGGRMSRNADAAPGRSEALVARARRILGDDFTICVDANGSYDAKTAIEVGKMLESYGVWFFEEPCPFEEFAMTKQVANALNIPIAGGEQDASMAKWRWLIAERAHDIVQPDLFYAGGFLRSLKVAQMAASFGLSCVPHAPRAHAGAATLLQFVALLDKPGEFHEFSAKAVGKSGPYGYTPELKIQDGKITIPNGPGFGLQYDEAELRKLGTPIPFDVPAMTEED